MTKVSLGWVILDAKGEPYRPKKNAYSSSTTPRVYSTEGRAKPQASYIKGTVVEVFYEKIEVKA